MVCFAKGVTIKRCRQEKAPVSGQCDDETIRLWKMDREKGNGGIPLHGTQAKDQLGVALIQPGRRRYRRLSGFRESIRVEPRIIS